MFLYVFDRFWRRLDLYHIISERFLICNFTVSYFAQQGPSETLTAEACPASPSPLEEVSGIVEADQGTFVQKQNWRGNSRLLLMFQLEQIYDQSIVSIVTSYDS